MKLENIGEVIASRDLSLIRDGQEPLSVEVAMGKPFSEDGLFLCPYHIKGAVELEVMSRDLQGRLTWDGDRDGDLGFPIADWIKG